MPVLRSSLVTANCWSRLRKLFMLVSAVIWWMITSGWAAATALRTASRSSPSTMTGVAPCLLSWLALSGERVLAVTSWPTVIRPGTRYWPITPVAPATKTRIVLSSLCFLSPLRRSGPGGRDT